jgi:hydroxyacylglutathione hydrolase
MNTTVIPVSLGFVKAFFIKGEKTVIVDFGIPDSGPAIKQAMKDNGIEPSDVALLLVTHAHPDHAGALKELKEYTGAKVAIHASEAAFLEAGKDSPSAFHIPGMKPPEGLGYPGVKPDILIGDRMVFKELGNLLVLHTPGHTVGCVTVVTDEGDAITGDMVGGTEDAPAIPDIYLDMSQMKRSIASLKNTNAKRVHTSHAKVYSIESVLKLCQ